MLISKATAMNNTNTILHHWTCMLLAKAARITLPCLTCKTEEILQNALSCSDDRSYPNEDTLT